MGVLHRLSEIERAARRAVRRYNLAEDFYHDCKQEIVMTLLDREKRGVPPPSPIRLSWMARDIAAKVFKHKTRTEAEMSYPATSEDEVLAKEILSGLSQEDQDLVTAIAVEGLTMEEYGKRIGRDKSVVSRRYKAAINKVRNRL